MIKTVIVVSAIRANNTLVSFGCMNEQEAAMVEATYQKRGHRAITRNLQERHIAPGKFAKAA